MENNLGVQSGNGGGSIEFYEIKNPELNGEPYYDFFFLEEKKEKALRFDGPIRVQLTAADCRRGGCGLSLRTSDVGDHILAHLSPDTGKNVVHKDGLKLNMLDWDAGCQFELRLKLLLNRVYYALNTDSDSWWKNFVNRLDLNAGDLVGLGWDKVQERLIFTVISRNEANPGLCTKFRLS